MISAAAVSEVTQSVISISLESALFYFAFRRRLHYKLTSFFIYIVLLLPKEFVWLYIGHTLRSHELVWIYFYWVSEFTFCFLRVLIISEICWRVLREYSAVWRLTWRFLAAIVALLFAWTGLTVWQHSHVFRDFVTLGLQRMELMQTLLILALFGIGAYYRIRISPFLRSVLIGISIFSATQVVVFQLGTIRDDTANAIFGYAHRLPYFAALVIWDLALVRLPREPLSSPDLISQQMYDELAPPVHNRLRELNDRLAELLRPKRRK